MCCVDRLNPHLFPYIETTEVLRRDLNNSDLGKCTTVSQYDGLGNATSQTLTSVGAGKSYTTLASTTFYNDQGPAWLIGLPTQSLVTKTIPGGASLTRKVDYVPDLVTGARKSETVEDGNTLLKVLTEYRRTQPFGLVNQGQHCRIIKFPTGTQ